MEFPGFLKTFKSFIWVLFLILIGFGCHKDQDDEPAEIEENYAHFLVKILIDQQTVDLNGGLEKTKEIIDLIFKDVNKIYNNQVVPLKYKYNFEPDLKNVVVYDQDHNDYWETEIVRKVQASFWGNPYHINLLFDGVRNFNEYATNDGSAVTGRFQGVHIIQNNKLIENNWLSELNTNSLSYPFYKRAYIIAHEFGHIRGCPDLYVYNINTPNPINGQTFASIPCIMGGWNKLQFSDYCAYILNMTGKLLYSNENKYLENDIFQKIENELQPDSVRFIAKGLSPGQTLKIELYPGWLYKTEPTSLFTFETTTGKYTVNYQKIFSRPYTYLVKFTDKSGKAGYSWLPRYEAQRTKMILNKTVHEISIDFSSL